MDNKQLTQKDINELLSIEVMCIQLSEKIKALRIKFAPTEEELKKRKKPSKKQIEKQMIKNDIEKYYARLQARALQARALKKPLLNGAPPPAEKGT